MTEGKGIRARIKRRLSMKEKNIDLDAEDFSDADEETSSHLQKEIEKAEKEGHDQGKPGGLLNRLIAHGNRKTEEQMRREMATQGGDGSK